jgi:hypothetical protein
VRREDARSKNHLDRVIGSGGPTVELTSSNGSIRLLKMQHLGFVLKPPKTGNFPFLQLGQDGILPQVVNPRKLAPIPNRHAGLTTCPTCAPLSLSLVQEEQANFEWQGLHGSG